MKKALLILSTLLTLSACSDEETYTASVSAVNLTAPDLDVFYHNADTDASLTNLQGLQYATKTPWNLLTQGEDDKTVYSFSAVDGNSQQELIEETALEFADYQEVVLYAFGKLSGVEQQAAKIKGLAVNFDNIAEQKFGLYVIHAYPAELGKLTVSIDNGIDSTLLSDDGLEYGTTTPRFTFHSDYNTLSVGQYDNNTNPMFKTELEFEPDAVNVVFIAPSTHNGNQIAAFNFAFQRP